jgi:hypothetical protein
MNRTNEFGRRWIGIVTYFERIEMNFCMRKRYLALFGGDPESLYLIKRENKRSLKSVYMKLSLSKLRRMADGMRAGVVHAAELHLYLRYRGVPESKIPESLRV